MFKKKNIDEHKYKMIGSLTAIIFRLRPFDENGLYTMTGHRCIPIILCTRNILPEVESLIKISRRLIMKIAFRIG
jgi:hypothetical protein